MKTAIIKKDAVTLEQIENQPQGDRPYIEKLMEERSSLQTQLVQVQSMLRLIEYHISEEILRQAGDHDRAN